MYTCAAVFYENKIQKIQKRQKETQARGKENKASNCEKNGEKSKKMTTTS